MNKTLSINERCDNASWHGWISPFSQLSGKWRSIRHNSAINLSFSWTGFSKFIQTSKDFHQFVDLGQFYLQIESDSFSLLLLRFVWRQNRSSLTQSNLLLTQCAQRIALSCAELRTSRRKFARLFHVIAWQSTVRTSSCLIKRSVLLRLRPSTNSLSLCLPWCEDCVRKACWSAPTQDYWGLTPSTFARGSFAGEEGRKNSSSRDGNGRVINLWSSLFCFMSPLCVVTEERGRKKRRRRVGAGSSSVNRNCISDSFGGVDVLARGLESSINLFFCWPWRFECPQEMFLGLRLAVGHVMTFFATLVPCDLCLQLQSSFRWRRR